MSKDTTVYCLSSVPQMVKLMSKVSDYRSNNMNYEPKDEMSYDPKMCGKMSDKVVMNNVFVKGGTPFERAVFRILFKWCRNEGIISRGGIDFHAVISPHRDKSYSMARSDNDPSVVSWYIQIKSGMDIREFIRCVIDINLYANHFITNRCRAYTYSLEKTNRYVDSFMKNNDIED